MLNAKEYAKTVREEENKRVKNKKGGADVGYAMEDVEKMFVKAFGERGVGVMEEYVKVLIEIKVKENKVNGYSIRKGMERVIEVMGLDIDIVRGLSKLL